MNNEVRMIEGPQGTFVSDLWTLDADEKNERLEELRAAGEVATFSTEDGGYQVWRRV